MSQTGPEIQALFSLFPAAGDFPEYQIIDAGEVPSPYHQLLVHDEHMTLTVEAHHGDFVEVEVLASYLAGDIYARKILLRLRRTRRVAQFGIVRVDLGFCTPVVRAAILEGKTPFGRILIDHNVLRRIEPTAYLRVQPGPATLAWFGAMEATYGRLAFIHCDEEPVVELLEIVAPEGGLN